MGTIAAALAGAALAVVLVGGPVWLLLPGLLGAALPALTTRIRARHAPPRVVTPSPRPPGRAS